MNPEKRMTQGAFSIETRILALRGVKVILDSDLAAIYRVSTKALNQAMKRNASRLPSDFLFPLTSAEKAEVVTTCDHLRKLKFSPVLPRALTPRAAHLTLVRHNARACIQPIR